MAEAGGPSAGDDETCLEEALDVALESSVDAIETTLQLREHLNELLEAGLIELARARFAMGNRGAVSALQLHLGDMKASRTVLSQVDERDRQPYFKLLVSADDEAAPANDKTDTARRRHGGDGDDQAFPDEVSDKGSDEEESTATAAGPSPSGDPLKWFGVLVPASLRRSQKCFAQALEVLTDVANEQVKLSSALDRYEKLRASGTRP
ncbi:coiled-coil domain-containing protein 115 [Ixodes scapularis]